MLRPLTPETPPCAPCSSLRPPRWPAGLRRDRPRDPRSAALLPSPCLRAPAREPAAGGVRGPVRRRAGLRQDGPRRSSSPRSRPAWRRNLAEIDAHRRRPRPADLREHDRGPGARRAAARPGLRPTGACGATTSRRREFRAIQAEMAPKLAEFQSKITQNAALFARIAGRATRVPRRPTLRARPAAARGARLRRASRATARRSRARPRSATRRSTSAWPSCTRSSPTTCSPTRRATSRT